MRDGGHVEARVFIWLAVTLVLVRVWTFAVVEAIIFNSDEALYGLMAKHISEFDSFPIFSYGEGCRLAVEAWITAPFFWLFGPTVLAMKIPLVLLNLVVALSLMHWLRSTLKLRPALAFVAALPFIMPTPVVAASLMANSGSATEPFLYIPLLWVLRGRPLAFGAVLMFGFLHREFTLYALPAMAVVLGLRKAWLTRAHVHWIGWVAAGSGLVWLSVDVLRRLEVNSSAIDQAEMLVNQACWVPAEWPARLGYVATTALPTMVGSIPTPFYDFSLRSPVITGGMAWLGWMLAGAVVAMLVRLAWTWRRASLVGNFGVFLFLVGCIAPAAYLLSCNLVVGATPVIRYILLVLLVPVGCFAAFIACERSRNLRFAMVAVFALWGAANLVDNVRVIRTAYVSPEAGPHRELADFLVRHDIRYARAGFWDSYIVDFLSGERVIVDSWGPIRIPEYTDKVNNAGDVVVDILRLPCDGQVTVAGAWCLKMPNQIAERVLGELAARDGRQQRD